MKRISPWLTGSPGAIHFVWVLLVLALTPGLAHAWHYVPARYRVQFSPYAFSYHRSGLVPGGLTYSLHAFDYRRSGLVFEGVRYTPYLFTYDKSGLIYDYGYGPFYGKAYHSPPVHVPVRCAPVVATHRAASSERGTSSYASRPARPVPRAALPSRQDDAVEVIRQYLQDRGFRAVDINRILRIENQLVSADFLLRDHNLLIKYWNPKEIEQLDTREGFKQRAYERYTDNWARIAEEHVRNGVEIYYVNASDTQTIVAALDSCTILDADPDRQIPRTLYARN